VELLNCGIICYIAPPGILRAFRFPILFLWRVSGGFGAKGNVTNNSTIPQFHANFSFGPFGVPFRSKCTYYQPKGPKSQKEVRIREIGNLKSRLVPPTPPQKCSMAVWQKPHTAIAAWHTAFMPAGWPKPHTAMLHFSSRGPAPRNAAWQCGKNPTLQLQRGTLHFCPQGGRKPTLPCCISRLLPDPCKVTCLWRFPPV
jgi:hypothetical protein